ncbi:MAG: HTH-type transcriptional regulator IscR [Candidatus Aerophobetes bacterium ADurb.Bin490]|nr:MAG: HTH-type transcriptional regulator IscR [Candidatus Aerophobetes bacterium ADurb.Bin490]HNZ28956.1 Rrf2 family transcriptional regulator [Candidatus Goldiibacteriota bacterium]HPI02918.1 Rrf2 family transcriptional regulator [Candidatus Goldiibacteriota bacterium]HPN64019.1 Rrf2 family transcriptional regulator [Candidatus Goldiibacteriota bacterium]HRQ42807.1 Rrf2 family transcriptional regulator [Candidatus Goldiibacteriota bacterium]
MNVSTKGRYALRALTHLAESFLKNDNKPVSIKHISERENISNRYLENIFVTLRKASIIKSIKGEKGGFMLAKPPKDISVYDVLEAVEKGVSPSKCVMNVKMCGNAQKCGIRKVWVGLDKVISGYLKQTKLSEVAENHTPQK